MDFFIALFTILAMTAITYTGWLIVQRMERNGTPEFIIAFVCLVFGITPTLIAMFAIDPDLFLNSYAIVVGITLGATVAVMIRVLPKRN